MNRWIAIVLGASMSACAGGPEAKPPPAPVVWASLAGDDGGAAWGTKKPGDGHGGASLGDRQLAAIKQYSEVFFADVSADLSKLHKEPETLANLYTPDATLTIAGVAEAKGRDGIVKAYRDVFGAFSPFRVQPAHIYQKGEVVVVHWTTTGAQKRDWMGFKADPSPDPIGFDLVSVLTFSPEGLIKEQRDHFDPFMVVLQIGEGPKGMDKPWRPSAEVSPFVSIATGSDVERENGEIPKKMSEAETKKDLAQYLSFLTDDVLHTGPLGTTKGKEAERKSLERLFNAFSDLEIKDEPFAVDDTVINEFTESGTNTGDLPPFHATRKKVTWHGVELYKIRGGKIAQLQVITNRAEFLNQLGLFKFPATK